MHATLYQASCFDTLAAVQAEGGADLVFTSPPYCDARTYGNAVSWSMEDYARLGDAIFAALKPGGHCLFNVDAPIREWRPGFGTERGFHPWKIMLDWAERVGFRVPDRLAFARLGSPGAYAGRFRNDWEPLFWFQRPGGDGFFDKHSIAAESKHEYGRKVITSRKNDGTLYVRAATGWAAENNKVQRGTLWDYGPIGGGAATEKTLYELNHPASFPYALAIDVVRCFAPVGGLVVDPFLGSGTSVYAAFSHGCRFIGGDLYHHEDGTPWVVKVRDMLANAFDPGALALFGDNPVPVVEVRGLSNG
jgi:DNA modification methylase